MAIGKNKKGALECQCDQMVEVTKFGAGGGAELITAGIHQYFEDFKRGTNPPQAEAKRQF